MKKSTISQFFFFMFVVALIVSGTGLWQGLSSKAVFASTHHTRHKIIVSMKAVRPVTPGSTVKPGGITTENCGTLIFFVDNLGNGVAGFSVSISSTMGGISSASYSGTWINHSRGNSGTIGNSALFPANPWEDVQTRVTQPGFVTASISATDRVGGVWPLGTVCQGYENDYDTIS